MATDNQYSPPNAPVSDIAAPGNRGAIKLQIRRMSPHQNAKVFAVLFAVSSAIFLVPFGLIATAFAPQGAGLSGGFLIAAPLIYLVFGYISTALGCMLYNFLFKFVGGIEYESDTQHI
jgi:hypothetical protein